MTELKRKHTPYQRIIRAAERGTGCYLTPENCAHMATDVAILQLAMNDDEDEQSERGLR